MRTRDLNQNDLQNILDWYNSSIPRKFDGPSLQEKNTVIKIRAMLIYCEEEDELFRRRFQR